MIMKFEKKLGMQSEILVFNLSLPNAIKLRIAGPNGSALINNIKDDLQILDKYDDTENKYLRNEIKRLSEEIEKMQDIIKDLTGKFKDYEEHIQQSKNLIFSGKLS